MHTHASRRARPRLRPVDVAAGVFALLVVAVVQWVLGIWVPGDGRTAVEVAGTTVAPGPEAPTTVAPSGGGGPVTSVPGPPSGQDGGGADATAPAVVPASGIAGLRRDQLPAAVPLVVPPPFELAEARRPAEPSFVPADEAQALVFTGPAPDGGTAELWVCSVERREGWLEWCGWPAAGGPAVGVAMPGWGCATLADGRICRRPWTDGVWVAVRVVGLPADRADAVIAAVIGVLGVDPSQAAWFPR